MNKRLSKSEEKYRKKFICEQGYNKEEQRIFDEAKKNKDCSYKALYKTVRSGYVYMFMVSIGARRAAEAMRKVGIEAEKLADYMHKFKSLEAASTDNNNYKPMLRPGVTVVRC